MINIFDYAKKELTLDAIIACFVAEPTVSKKFVSAILGIPEEKVKFIEGLSLQRESIDVFFEVDIEGKKEAVIIEDKTDSFLHSLQSLNYIYKKAKCKYDKIHYVLIKTGNYYIWERDQYEQEQKLIKGELTYKNGFYGRIFVGDPKEVEKKIEVTKDLKIEFHEFLLNDLKKFINTNKMDFSWYDDLKSFYNKKTNDSLVITNLKNKTEDFINDLTGIKTDDFIFSIPDGNGKHYYELIFLGHCGNKAKLRKVSTDMKESYYLLPCIKFNGDDISMKLQVHVFADEKERVGYLKSKKLNSIQINNKVKIQTAIVNKYGEDFKNNGFFVLKNIKDDTLSIFDVNNMKWSKEQDQIIEKARYLLQMTKQIQKDLEKSI